MRYKIDITVRVNLIYSILIFREKNIVHIIVRMNLTHFKQVFFFKMLIKLTLKKNYVNNASELNCLLFLNKQCNSLVLFI